MSYKTSTKEVKNAFENFCVSPVVHELMNKQKKDSHGESA